MPRAGERTGLQENHQEPPALRLSPDPPSRGCQEAEADLSLVLSQELIDGWAQAPHHLPSQSVPAGSVSWRLSLASGHPISPPISSIRPANPKGSTSSRPGSFPSPLRLRTTISWWEHRRPPGARRRGGRVRVGLGRGVAGRTMRGTVLEAVGRAHAKALSRRSQLPLHPWRDEQDCGKTALGLPPSSSSQGWGEGAGEEGRALPGPHSPAQLLALFTWQTAAWQMCC